jgi:signal transduction histidine kinase
MTKPSSTQRLAWSIAALSLATVVIGFAISLLALVDGDGGDWLRPHTLFNPFMTVAFAFVGALVASRHPGNPIGWILSAIGLLSGLTFLAFTYQLFAESAASNNSLPGAEIALWINMWIWLPAAILPVTFLLLLFPDGRLPSSRWWPVALAAALGLTTSTLGIALHPFPPIEPVPPSNPFGIPGAAGAFDLLLNIGYLFLSVGILGSLGALAVRFRRSRGIEREQLKWLAYGSVIGIVISFIVGVPSLIWPADTVAYELAIISTQLAMSIVAVAIGVAILRYRLYSIDVVINRTLVYGALSAGVVGLYVLLVGSLGAVFQSSGNFVLTLIATGLAALLVQPLRARLQRSVNRLMYGERDDPYTVLSHLSQQLKTTLAPTAVLPGITEAIARTLKLPYVALALKKDNRLEIAAAYGSPSGAPLQLPLVYQAETVGHLYVAPRAPGESFTPAERRLLEDIALQAGVAAHAVRLTDDLQRARERLVTAREEERRRLRRDLHDGLGPQLASMTLTVAATRELLRHDPDAADLLLQELAGHTQAAIADIRRLVYALRPPALDDLGLVPALREQAEHYNQSGLHITISAPDQLPPLPAAVEVAAYRIVQEAITNVVRHARARTCTVRLMLNEALEVEIKDDGVGMPVGTRAGVGLTSMHERTAELGGTCEIEPAPGSGTTIRARLPLHQEINPESAQESAPREVIESARGSARDSVQESVQEGVWTPSVS